MENHLCKYMYIYVTMSGIESFYVFNPSTIAIVK